MKLSVLMSLLLLMTGFVACDNDDGVNLTENPEAREDVYQQILNDEEMFTEFMTEMRESPKSMEWMRANRPMMRNMYGRQQMQSMMKTNPGMMDTVMQEMMMVEWDTTRMQRNPQMRQLMIQRMRILMERDTAMAREMHEMMQQTRPGSNMMR
ncbi:hypothetical protein [Salinimicrobium flavum]|uniref:Uncharacterized protein n=1 Tax=Salinimicrobium flavum TaxID=1737065 RepID=A0ABW5J0F7_9FLAO